VMAEIKVSAVKYVLGSASTESFDPNSYVYSCATKFIAFGIFFFYKNRKNILHKSLRKV